MKNGVVKKRTKCVVYSMGCLGSLKRKSDDENIYEEGRNITCYIFPHFISLKTNKQIWRMKDGIGSSP